MKGFWMKKLPALLLAVLMTASLTPAALAAVNCQHENWSAWSKLNDAQHQRKCLTSGCTSTQEANHTWSTWSSDASTHWQKCSECGAETAHAAHTYSGAMKIDTSNHWDQCTVCGYKDNLGGHVDLNGDGKCDTCGYAVGTASVTVTFINCGRTYTTQSVRKGYAPSNPGTPSKSSSGSTSYAFKGWTTQNPGSTGLYDRQPYLTSAEVARTNISTNTTYYALYTEGVSTDITWKVKPGGQLDFDRTVFRDLFNDTYSNDSLRYVVFEADTSLKSSNGTLYRNYTNSSSASFTRSTLEDYSFYYSSSRYGDYPISDLTFVADSGANGKTVTLGFTLFGADEELTGTLEIKISNNTSTSSDADIVYKVDPGKTVSLNRTHFKDLFDDEYDDDDTFRYVVFTPTSSYKSSNGCLFYDYNGRNEESFPKSDLEDYEFYYSSSRYGDYPISDIVFVAEDDTNGEIVTLNFTLYGDDEELDGTLEFQIGTVDANNKKGDITYTVDPGKEVEFDRADFNSYYREEYSGTVRYVTFYPDSTLKSSNGIIYSNYDGRNEEKFDRTSLADTTFYYSDDTYGDYALDSLSFVADDDFDGSLTIKFRAWYSSDRYVEGNLVINAKTKPATTIAQSNLRYYITGSTALQINANDIARFYEKQFPGSKLQYVDLISVPVSGALYHDYYTTGRTQLTTGSIRSLYLEPSGSQYDLGKLTYIPSGTNYCGTILFTAYGTGGHSVLGSILISVTRSTISEVYGVTPRNTTVSFPASAIYSAVQNATGTALDSIQLLQLPATTVGSITIISGGVSTRATTSDKYGYNSGTQQISQLKFVPAANYTGSVEIPYKAYDKSGNSIAAGKFCLGVVNNVKRFSDVSSSTWCYKYVTELSDAGVIGGYADNTFKSDSTVTYGAALKLIMLASGNYGEIAPTVAGQTFSGYLARAKADGLVSGEVDLTKPITRLQVSQLAAKAMRLDVNNLSSNRPFTDTADVYVQALNAAGIVEGYFANGSSTFKPGNTLTRGQASAIVWRMRNYNK